MKPHSLSLLLLSFLSALTVHAADSVPRITAPPVRHPGTGQIYYIVMTDRFANGDPGNDTGGIPGGPDDHGFDPTRISHYHGGDLRGLTSKLDYIKALGVTTVWLTPPYKNKPYSGGSAGYHGYWPLDFETIDPHFGTEAEFAEFVRETHARGMRVCFDIIVNHTADVIDYREKKYDYVSSADAPYRDANGVIIDESAIAYDGTRERERFPALSVEKSFAYVPVIPAAEAQIKNPTWLNDPRYYHNRGNSTFKGKSALDGDFMGLDDLFTEHPRVVKGFIEIFKDWVTRYEIDSFRIDTAKHANIEFWQAFGPALREHARQLGRPHFFQFGEVMDEDRDAAFLSEYSTKAQLDGTLDFPFQVAARGFISKSEPAGALAALVAKDDYYTDADSNVHSQPTLMGNYDIGRFGYMVRHDNPGIGDTEVLELNKLAHALLFLGRGQPVLCWGDEQGMIGNAHDMGARETMFPSKAKVFREMKLLGSKRTGADDKFDPAHPLYRMFAQLAKLRAAQPALTHGAMIVRDSGRPEVFAFSRVDRAEKIELVAALNRSRTERSTVKIPTGQVAGATWALAFDSKGDGSSARAVVGGDNGEISLTLEPMQAVLWRSEKPWPMRAAVSSMRVAIEGVEAKAPLKFETREAYGTPLFVRREVRAEIGGGDELGEVTFALERISQPGKFEILGTDDAPPYRVFWAKPKGWAAGERVRFIATHDDLRGGVVSAASEEILLE